MYFWIAPLRCKQKPLLKQLWPTRNKIAWLGTDLVLDFLLDYVKVRLNSTTGLQRTTFSKLPYIYFDTPKCATNYVISFEVS